MKKYWMLIGGIGMILCLAGIAYAQAVAVPWNEAQLTITPPVAYLNGGSLPDPLTLSYQVETLDPGKTEWRILGTTTKTVYHIVRLSPGKHQYRVRVLWAGTVSEPSNVSVKEVVAPPLKPPVISIL